MTGRLLFAAALAAALAASAAGPADSRPSVAPTAAPACSVPGAEATEPVKISDCARDAALDYWAAADSKFCCEVMAEVFKTVGLKTERQAFGPDGQYVLSNSVVLCSVFRTPELEKHYLFPLQPLGRMHFGLYTTQARAERMRTMKITDWPRLCVGYSPVSQGKDRDRENYFEHAKLSPQFREYKKSVDAVEALRNDEIDALFLYTPFGKRPEGLVEIVPIGSRNVYFAVRKDHPELLKKLSAAYRECYISNIDRYDELKKKHLGITKPNMRIRVAAYQRGGLFEVSPDGEHSGPLAMWMKELASHSNWTFDYVYGDYDESLEDVREGRLDMVAGLGFSALRRKEFFFPHTPMGMLRVYLWTRHGSKYKAGQPETWRGMKVGLLSGTVSAAQMKRSLLENPDSGIQTFEYSSDMKMLADYASGKIDACVDVEMPELANELALHLFVTHPMYICLSMKRPDLHEPLEKIIEEICDDFPRYMRMISEHHYGDRSEMAALSLDELAWLEKHKGETVKIDFSPWPYEIFGDKGEVLGMPKALTEEISRRTGLKVVPQEQTGVQTAEAKFMRRDTQFWIPYPAPGGSAVYKARSVFSLPMPQNVNKQFGAKDPLAEFEMFAAASADEMLVSILRKIMTGMDSSMFQEMFMQAAADRRVQTRVETVHDLFGLDEETIKTIAYAAGIAGLSLIFVYGFVMMILLKRQAKRANAAAAAAEDHAQAKTRFLAMMSHELRTPLNAVIGFAEFLARDGANETLRKEYTEGILTSSNALLQLINDVLDLSKLEAGATKMRFGRCDMTQLLGELPAIFGYRVRKRGVRLEVSMPRKNEIPPLVLSQQGMRQILVNLVGNASKFTDEGVIRVRCEWVAETRTLHIEVADTGCGMTAEKKEKLFDPFVQDIRSRMMAGDTDTKGTGLGLPIVKRMVDNARGAISVSSEVGHGTTFIIDIPNLEIAPVEAPQQEKETVPRGIPASVLVVDDMMMNRKILAIHLRNLGVKDIRQAENGVKALEAMKSWEPDCVLTDMWMPEMDGTSLAMAMNKDIRLRYIPIVAVTADVDVESSYDMSLFVKVMSKPVTGEKLKALFAEMA